MNALSNISSAHQKVHKRTGEVRGGLMGRWKSTGGLILVNKLERGHLSLSPRICSSKDGPISG